MTFQQHFGRILKQIFRRKSYPSIFAAACFLLIFVVRDIQKFNAETSASTFKSEIISSHLSQVKFIQDDGKRWGITFYRVCHRFRLTNRYALFWDKLNLTTFKSSNIFRGSWGSSENWIEPKTKPPSGNIACPDRCRIQTQYSKKCKRVQITNRRKR